MGNTGHRIKHLRKQRDWTQSDLAKRLGVTRNAISMYESDTRHPPANVIEAIADIFNVSTDYLLGRTDDPSPPNKPSEYDPNAPDWFDHAPAWLRDLYEDPDFRPYLDRPEIREVLLDPANRIFLTWEPRDAETDEEAERKKKEFRLDILKYTVWRLDQEG